MIMIHEEKKRDLLYTACKYNRLIADLLTIACTDTRQGV